MDQEKSPKTTIRRPEVLKKLNADSLLAIERGLLGDLPAKLRPQPLGPVRGRPTLDIAVAKPTSILSSCLIGPDSASSGGLTSSDDECSSPAIKKTFSFRNKLSRLSFFGKDKERPKAIVEDEYIVLEREKFDNYKSREEIDHKSKKRFWFNKNKEVERRERESIPIYKRSKSFEFLPRAIEEDVDDERNEYNNKNVVMKTYKEVYGSKDKMDDVWSSNDSLEFISPPLKNENVAYFTNTKKEAETMSVSSKSCGSSVSTVNSTNSSGVVTATNIMQRGSVQCLLDEFEKTVEIFSENYLSDSEPYTKHEKDLEITKNSVALNEKRKSSSLSSLQYPDSVLKNNRKVSEISDEFKKELSVTMSDNKKSVVGRFLSNNRSCRRGSVTDWFVLEERGEEVSNKYSRALQKPTNRVRRMSSTKYWITPEECAVYSREQRAPLVIPRITHFRPRHERPLQHVSGIHSYAEEAYQEPTSVKSSVRQYERLHDWSPSSERGLEQEQRFKTTGSDSPPFYRLNKRLGGSTENLLINNNIRRPTHLQLPASSSGDSLDVEVREKQPVAPRSRKSRSMVAPKQRMRSPVPAPRLIVNQPAEAAVVYEGPVKRTKFSESGKKCKKNWNDSYMLLTQTALVFYKDQRTYHASRTPKPAGTPPSPTAPRAELVLPLRNAHVVQCIQMHTRRFTRSLVLTVGYDQYLLQDETEDGAKRWLNRIQNIIFKLGPPVLEEFPTSQYQSSNTDLESLGRTPPVSRHPNRAKQKGGSSNEDLSDSTEISIQKSHVKSRLRKFFAKRPAMEVLVKKGIYKDEPVFGRNLDEVCPATSPRVPDFVVACVREIERSEENMCTDGLYRASGNLSQVQKIRLEIDQNNLSVIEKNPDIHVLTGSLKLFFRELKEPLIPCSMFDRILSACSIKPREARTREFRDIVQALPACNRETLKFVLEHLLRVTQYSEKNRMHTANLAIVFGPTLLWAPAAQAHNIAVDCIQQNNVVDILLTDFKEIFTEDNRGKKKS